MTPDRWHRIESLLHRTLELSSTAGQEFLNLACGSDAALRKEVESLIRDDKQASYFKSPSMLAGDQQSQPPTVQEPLAQLPPGTVGDAPGSTVAGSRVDNRFAAGAMLAGRYRIVSFLGRGGMGEVYRADDLKLDQPVALKFLPGPRQRDEASLSRLLAEVKIARQISHPNVCRVHDVGEAEGRHFLSMEYIDGENLACLLRRIGRLPKDKALELVEQLCQGLAAAHEQGILHRDLKPSNLMIDGRGQARITDFGIATLAESIVGREAGRGTPAYMAPEQLAGEEVTARSDLYALGLILYELFTGRQAFPGRTPASRIGGQDQGMLIPPSRWVDGLEPAIEQVILRCLEVDPRHRPATAAAVAVALRLPGTSREWLPALESEIPHRSSWVLKKKLGEGGFGEVWLAHHRKTRDRRVFKFCHETARLYALQREITVFRLLKEELGDRDDIARILDWSFEEPPYFIESEYTEGGDLLEWAREQGGLAAVPLESRLEIVAQVATAVAAAHSVGVLHKDVKPTNVLIARDSVARDPVARDPVASSVGQVQALLTDFGLGSVIERQRLAEAKITVAGLSEKTKAGTGGTRLYMAPELLEGKSATLQSDTFALGVMLYQVVLGDFARALAPGWRRDIDDELLREDIAAAVDGSPERRLSDTRELARRLRSLSERRAERMVQRRRQAEARQAQVALERSRRRRKIGAVIIGALVIVAIGMGLLASQIAREKERTESEAARAKNTARIAVAGEWLRDDPTRAALVLLDVENPEQTPYAVSQMRRVLQEKLATVELRGHDGPILSGCWSPRGDRVLTVSRDRSIRVWKADGAGAPAVISLSEQALAAWFDPRGDRLLTFSAQGVARAWGLDGSGGGVIVDARDGNLRVVAMSPLGDRVVTGSWSGRVRLWKVDGSGEVADLAGHEGPVTAGSFSPRGDLVVTASQDGSARVWRTDGSGDPMVFEHDDALVRVDFDPTGGRVLTASTSGTAAVWRIDSSDEPFVFKIPGEIPAAVDAAWSPGGDRVALAAGDTTWIRNADGSGDAVVLSGPANNITAAADITVSFSPNGDQVLTAFGEGAVAVWNADGSGEPVVLKHRGAGVRAEFSWDGAKVLTMSREGIARVWEVAPPTEPAVLRHAADVRIAAWSPSGTRLATAAEDGTVDVWSAGGSRQAVLREGHEGDVEIVSWSPSGDRLLIASRAGPVRIWALDGSSDPVALRGSSRRPSAAVWSREGDRVLTGSEDGTVRVWRADGRGDAVVLGPPAGSVLAVAWGPDDEAIVAANHRQVLLWADASVGEPEVLLAHDAPIETVSFSPTGDRVVIVSEEGTTRAWSLGNPSRLYWAADHEDFVFDVAFSSRGDLLTTTAEGTVSVFREDFAKPRVVRSRQGAVYAASWSPGGEHFVTASEDGRARIWSVRGGEPRVLEGHTDQIMDVSWSPRGDRIVTVSLDGTARIWRVETADLVALIAATTRVCLDPGFRHQALGDSPEAALESYQQCERAQGRTP